MTEYIPETDLKTSQEKLNYTASHQVEIRRQDLFEGVSDVLASRAGERWKESGELGLWTSANLMLFVGYDQLAIREGFEAVRISTRQLDGVDNMYSVTKDRRLTGTGYVYELLEHNISDGTSEAVENFGHLATARLYALLAQAQAHTPSVLL